MKQNTYMMACLFAVAILVLGKAHADSATITAEDRGAILDLISQYPHTFDRRDGAAFANLYTEDGEWLAFPNGTKEPTTLRGRKAIETFANDRQEMFKQVGIVTKHFMLNTTMEVISPTRVKTSSMALITWQRPIMGNPKPEPVQGGYYNHVIVKQNDAWKFQRIEVHTSGVYKPEELYGEELGTAK